ncbi:YceD family protein [Limisalsivibrio acetivorans]|uniref:YceD family protein n=1 Tax=Limisalsivibrio acetivorans TaxID=1304888 RepID=UPI0003B33949|nr:DUF177 domain-containing protein [Limisalsivibrio acetivorans]
MKLYFESINEEGKELETELSFEFDEGTFERVAFSGSIYPLDSKNEEFFLDGRLDSEVVLTCDRCLKKRKLNLGEQVRVRVLAGTLKIEGEEIELSDEDAGTYEGAADHIDLHEILKQESLLLLPMKVTCDEDCAEELPIEEEEDNTEPEKDSRWEKLRKLKE